MADVGEDDAKNKAEERERKKAEVRKRLEESGKLAKKAKKGFLTPDRKKKLRKLLMMKAAEDLKRQQQAKDEERKKALQSRIIPLPDVDSIEDKGKLESIYNELWSRVCQLEGEKFDINAAVTYFDNDINQLSIKVNDLRGKYAKPPLKKVSKYDNKFKKMAESGKGEEKQDFRANLKVVKKDTNVIDEALNKRKQQDDKPDWSKKGGAHKEAEAAAPKEEEEKSAAPAPAPAPPAAEEEAPAAAAEEEEEEEDEEEEEAEE